MNKNNHPVKNSLNFRHPSGGWEFPVFGTMSGLSSQQFTLRALISEAALRNLTRNVLKKY